MALEREDIIDGLNEIIHRSRAAGLKGVSIRIVGGAALRLAHFERASTVDIDAHIQPFEQISPLAEAIALERGWPADWLNNNAVMFIPSWGRQIEWESLYDDEAISISVAPIEALLAMKIQASRAGRDTDDIVQLLALNRITTVDQAERLVEDFYPGDSISDKGLLLLERIFALGLPERPATLPPVELG